MRLCSDCDELYIWFSFYILFLSNSCMFSVAFYCFGQVVDSNSKRECLCLIVGSCPPMSSLRDRNMGLGDVMLPLGKKMVLVIAVARIVYLTRSLLMQLSVALGLHFGWGSQLNTSEMFWIDISRWMISE